ncbi:hypothetical protein BJ741DRAFT_667657 [Chytriomyces cf. hyalinus JEL632]|nr:hypothetical protein BJ741DRAFT_667657 [Chytriomyces cf. hyalinus JEL632]
MHKNSPAAVASFTSKNLVFTHNDSTGLPLSRNGTADSTQSRSSLKKRSCDNAPRLDMCKARIGPIERVLRLAIRSLDDLVSSAVTGVSLTQKLIRKRDSNAEAEPIIGKHETGSSADINKGGQPSLHQNNDNNQQPHNNSNMPAIASSAGAQSSSMFPCAQALSMGSPKPQPASETRAESPVSTASESSTTSIASILSQQSMTASALFLGNKVI